MRCGGCGHWSPATANFCAACGATIRIPELPGSAPRGAGGDQAGPQGELRQLTVIFCDLVGSTALSTRLDPEELGDITALYHQEVVQVVEHYQGEVVRYLGDGVLIEFGWPAAHDDDCERAVRAAIDIAAAIEVLDGETSAGVALAVRIGVHTGPVFVGELGAGGRRETVAIGETMNTAARLQEAAMPGTAVISEATLRLVRGIFVVDELEPRAFKGLPVPLKAYRVVQPSGMRSRLEATGDRLTRFVGRDRELQELRELWRRTRSGSGGAVLITGEPGVGKSRLAYELRQHVKDQAHSWLDSRCSSYTQHSAFRPAIELLERGLALKPDDTLEHRLAQLERALTRTGVNDPDAISLLSPLLSLAPIAGSNRQSPEFQRRETQQLIVRWATALAGMQPLIVLVEDLQWADVATLELFESLAEGSTNTGLMVIGTARTGFEAPWPDAAPVSTIELRPMGQQDIRTLVSRLAASQLPQPVVDRVVQDAAGIPLFAEEIGFMLLESDLLVEGEDGLELVVPLERMEIPMTLQDSLMARLDHIHVAKQVALHAAVIGREFDQGLIEVVAGLDPELVGEGLAQLVRDQLVFSRGEPPNVTYTFKHALIQEAAYRSLLKRTRRQLHARTAKALELRLERGGLDLTPEVVARHYEAAGMLEHAIACYRDAATQSAQRSGHRDAAEHLRRALGLISGIPEAIEQRCDILITLGESNWNAGDFEQAQQAYREAAEIAARLQLPEQLARAALGYGGRMGFGAGVCDDALIALLEAALEALTERHGHLRARVMARLAEALTFSETAERRASLCRQALDVAQAAGDPAVVASVLTNEHWALWSPDNLNRRLSVAREIVALAQQAEDPMLEAEGRMWLVSDLMEAGDLEAVDREFEVWATLAERIGQRYQLWAVAVTRAMRTLMRGRLGEGERQAQDALEIGQRDRNQNAVQLFGVQLSHARREQGRWLELEAPLQVFVEQFESIPTWRCALAAMYGEAGRTADARRVLDVLAADGFTSFRKDIFWLADVTLAGDTSALLGDVERAQALYEQILPYARRCVMAGPFTACWGSSSRTLAGLAACIGRWTDAESHFEDALEHNRDLGATLALARTQLEYAEMLSVRASHRDHERALELLAEVIDTAEYLSLDDRSRRAQELKAKIERAGPALGASSGSGPWDGVLRARNSD